MRTDDTDLMLTLTLDMRTDDTDLMLGSAPLHSMQTSGASPPSRSAMSPAACSALLSLVTCNVAQSASCVSQLMVGRVR